MIHIKKNGVDIPLNKLVSTSADGISYNNTESGLTADDVQDAIDEVVDDIESLDTSKQPKTLSSPITIAGESKTTVEGALDGLNDFADDNISAIVNVYGSKNKLLHSLTSATVADVTYTVNDDKSFVMNGTANASAPRKMYAGKNNYKNDIFSDVTLKASANNYYYLIVYYDNGVEVSSDFYLQGQYVFGDNNYDIEIYVCINSGDTVTNVTAYPMIRDARISDDTYVPYAMTNRELTEKAPQISRDNNSSTTVYFQFTIITPKGHELEVLIGKYDENNNYIQFLTNGIDRGYLLFDVSRNVGQI